MSVVYDVCIVGAGVSGASLAAHLGNKNLKIALLDLSFEERDRIVGELMQPGGVFMLKQLGLADVLDDIDSCDVKGYALYNNEKNIVINYSNEAAFEGITGKGLNNGKFIQALRKKSFNKENIDLIKGKAVDFIEVENNIEGVVYESENKINKSLLAKLTIVCDGFFSGLRSKLIPENKTVTSHFAGLVLQNCKLPHENYGHIFMGGKAPFLCYRISKGEVRLLVDFPGGNSPLKGEALSNYLLEEVLPELPMSMYDSLIKAIEVKQYKFMPNHYMSAIECKKTGVAMVGDSLNMRHPLTGGGMTAALTDVTLLCKAILKDGELNDAQSLNQNIANYYKERNSWNASINIMADALYKVTLNQELKDACFNYLAKGESYAKQPIDLLSGISRDNSVLFKHFIQVAVLGAKDNLLKHFDLKNIDSSFSMLKNASQILYPLILNEKEVFNTLTKRKIINEISN